MTRHWPIVECFWANVATRSFVPTPSTLDTSTGLSYLSDGILKHPPKEPKSDNVYLLYVDVTCD